MRLCRSSSISGVALTALTLVKAVAEPIPSLTPESLETGEAWEVDVSDQQLLTASGDAIDLSAGWAEFCSAKSVEPPYVVEAVVRFPTGKSNNMLREMAMLRTGVSKHGEAGLKAAYSMMVHAPSRGEAETNKGAGFATMRNEQTDELGSNGRSFNTGNGEDAQRALLQPRFPAESISPIWPAVFRREVVQDMAAIPLTKDVWRRVRIEVDGSGRARLWMDGFLAADYREPAEAAGQVSLRVYGPMRVKAVTVSRPKPGDPRFIPIPLDHIANATGFVDTDSIPDDPGKVPFASAGEKHVDVGRSLFRYRLHEGFRAVNSPNTMPAPEEIDPARIRLRVPAAPVSRIWILAAADGEDYCVPTITARFFRHKEGYPLDSVATVPAYSEKSAEGGAKRVPVRMADGKPGSLWAVPVEVDTLRLNTEFQGEPFYELELAKEMADFRAFPDPTYYGSQPAGLASAVRVFAMTLETAPLSAISTGNLVGNIFKADQPAIWNVDLTNHTGEPLTTEVSLEVAGPYGEFRKSYRRSVTVPPRASEQTSFELETQPFGLYSVLTNIQGDGVSQRDRGAFVKLAPDRRKADAKTSRWGLYYWGGGHDTNPDQMRNIEILHAIGARTGASNSGEGNLEARRKFGVGPKAALLVRRVPDWARQNPVDPAARRAWQEEIREKLREKLETEPDLEFVSLFAESSVSLRLTHGMPPQGNGRTYHDDLTGDELEKLRIFYATGEAAVEAFRDEYPNIKVNFGHAAPLFCYPFFQVAEEMGFDMTQFESYGVDSPQFERMPERPPRATEPSLMWFQQQLLAEHGLHDKVELVHLESYFPPNHPLGLGRDRQADHIVRTAVHGFAWGTDGYLSALAALYTPADYWGTSHYGAAALIGHGPRFDGTPPVAAYATMTQMLDLFEYDGWLDTGSRGAFAIRFEREDGGHVFCCYTIRGRRTMRFDTAPGVELTLTDMHGNSRPLTDEFDISERPVWVEARGGEVTGVELGEPDHGDAEPAGVQQLLEDFKGETWTVSANPLPGYAENHWDVEREPAPMMAELIRSAERDSRVLRVALGDGVPDDGLLLRRYAVLEPPAPIAIPGKARSLGLRVRGTSGWKRVIYEIEDAEGEIYRNVGTKDAWNCDDIHSWSHTNFDGWRFVEFPLPGNAPGDGYREKDSVWWGHSGGDEDGVVDLPVRLNRVVVEMATHQIYLDSMLPVLSRDLEIDDLVAVYDNAEMRTDAPVELQRAAASVGAVGEVDMTWLPNPVAELAENAAAPAPSIVRLYPPEQRRAGTTLYVEIQPVDGAKSYRVYVSTEADGLGSKEMGRASSEEPNVVKISGLQPNIPMYIFATYLDAESKESKPSKARRTVLKDEFPMK